MQDALQFLVHSEQFLEPRPGTTAVAESVDELCREHDEKKGHMTYIVEAWVTDRGYMTDAEFKQKRKEIDALSSTGNMWHMPLQELEAYEREHNIPTISNVVRKAVALITRDRWTK